MSPTSATGVPRFTATTTTIEVNATGTKLRPVTRVGKFTNLPELLALSSIYTDVVTRDQVPVALPTLHTGQRQIISLQPDIEVVDFITDLGWRLDDLDARQPQRDNQLKISTDGRNASLDPRLAHLAAPPRSRADAVAEQDHPGSTTSTPSRAYTHPDTREPAGTGALQIVFCDRGTPTKNPGQFSIYQAVKDELTELFLTGGVIFTLFNEILLHVPGLEQEVAAGDGDDLGADAPRHRPGHGAGGVQSVHAHDGAGLRAAGPDPDLPGPDRERFRGRLQAKPPAPFRSSPPKELVLSRT